MHEDEEKMRWWEHLLNGIDPFELARLLLEVLWNLAVSLLDGL